DGNDGGLVSQRHFSSEQLQPRQLITRRSAGEIDAAVVERAGDIGKVDPFGVAMRPPLAFGEGANIEVAVDDGDGMTWLERMNIFRLEAEVEQCNTFDDSSDQ